MSAQELLRRRVGVAAAARMSRLLLAVALGVASLGGALALAGLLAWLITNTWQMPPVLNLSVAVVAVRALGISRAVFGFCQRLVTTTRHCIPAGAMREQLYDRLARGPVDRAMRLRSGPLVTRLGGDVDELSDLLVRFVLPNSHRPGTRHRRGGGGGDDVDPRSRYCWPAAWRWPESSHPGSPAARSCQASAWPRGTRGPRRRGDGRARLCGSVTSEP